MAVPIIPDTVTFTIDPTFSPPTTCFDTAARPTYTVRPEGNDSLQDGRIVIKATSTPCYPSPALRWQTTPILTTATVGGSAIATSIPPTAPYYAASNCPQGFQSAGSQLLPSSTTLVFCCPAAGDYQLKAIGVENYSGCILAPTAPVTIVNGSSPTTLAMPSDEPYGISYIPLEIGFVGNDTSDSGPSNEGATPDDTSSSGLSTGAKAGIGVGVVIGFVALFFLGFLFWRIRKIENHKSKSDDETPTQHKHHQHQPETIHRQPTELTNDDSQVHELSPYGMISEAGEADEKKQVEQQSPVELEGGWVGWEVSENGRRSMYKSG